MGDFDSSQLLSDWDDVLGRAGSLTAVTGGVTFDGVWAGRVDALAEMDEQLRNEKRFTVFTTYTELPTPPTTRQTVVRAGVTYFVESVRVDAEGVAIEFDVKSVL
jgi:hypothetical protein